MGGATNYGIGDTEFGAKIRFVKESSTSPKSVSSPSSSSPPATLTKASGSENLVPHAALATEVLGPRRRPMDQLRRCRRGRRPPGRLHQLPIRRMAHPAPAQQEMDPRRRTLRTRSRRPKPPSPPALPPCSTSAASTSFTTASTCSSPPAAASMDSPKPTPTSPLLDLELRTESRGRQGLRRSKQVRGHRRKRSVSPQPLPSPINSLLTSLPDRIISAYCTHTLHQVVPIVDVQHQLGQRRCPDKPGHLDSSHRARTWWYQSTSCSASPPAG